MRRVIEAIEKTVVDERKADCVFGEALFEGTTTTCRPVDAHHGCGISGPSHPSLDESMVDN